MICTEVYFLLVETILRLNYHDQNFKKPFSVGAAFESNARARLCIPCNVACASFGIVKNCCNSTAFTEFRKIISRAAIAWGNGNSLIKRWVMLA